LLKSLVRAPTGSLLGRANLPGRASQHVIRESKPILPPVISTASPKSWEVGSLTQWREILLRGEAASNKEEGHAYLHRLLSCQKKEGSSE
jgi:hypothetical protein